jgi:hypothetical protein
MGEYFLYFLCAVMVLCVLGIAWAQFMLYRNRWVYRERTRLISEYYLSRDYEPAWRWDANYLSYDEMMRRWWIWDVEKLRKSR